MAFKLALNICKSTAATPCAKTPRLISIGFSHFCEKARWALDLSPLSYYEEMHCPGMHLSSTLNLTKTARIANWNDSHFDNTVLNQVDIISRSRKEKSAVPKLYLPKLFAQSNHIATQDSIVSNGSSGIAKFLSVQYPESMSFLYPPGVVGDNVIDFESYLDTTLGPSAMHWAFGNLLLSGREYLTEEDHQNAVTSTYNKESAKFFIRKVTNNKAIAPMERFIVGTFGSFVVPIMTKNNHITAASREAGLVKINEVFAVVDEMLLSAAARRTDDSSQDTFLFNTDQPTAADIAFAALTLPVLLAPQTRLLFSSLEELEGLDPSAAPGCARLARVARELTEKHASARYALRLYDQYRFRTSDTMDKPRFVEPTVKPNGV